MADLVSLVFYTVGLIIIAGSSTVGAVAARKIIYSVGKLA